MKASLALIVICGLASLAFGQNAAPDSTLTAAEKLYNAGSYESAELTARHVMEEPNLSDSARIAAERIIAFSLVAQGTPSLAKDHFISILRLNSAYQLDPILTSPKILTVFNEAKLQFAGTTTSGSGDRRVIETGQAGPSFRSILFPGWEQCYVGRTGIGVPLLGAGFVTIGSGITFEILRSTARRDYLSATQPADIASKYTKYNRYYRIEAYSFIAFAAAYVASELEIFLDRKETVGIHPTFVPLKGPELAFVLRW